MIIYKTTNLINNKIYIGKTLKKGKRFEKYFGSGIAIQKAIKKYGIRNFKKEIIEICFNEKKLNEKEIYWISFYNSNNPKIGYNISLGGDGGGIVSNYTRKKLSNACSGEKNGMFGSHRIRELNPFYKKNHSNKTKNQISNTLKDKYRNGEMIHSMKGKHHSKESKEKISLAKLGKKLTNEHKRKLIESHKGTKGYKFSKESKQKMSISKAGKYNGKNNPRYIYLPKNIIKNIVFEYDNNIAINKIAKIFNLSVTKINNILKEEGIK